MYRQIDKLLFDEVTVVKDHTSRKTKKSNTSQHSNDTFLQLSAFGIHAPSNISMSQSEHTIIRQLICKIHQQMSKSTQLRTKLQNQQQCLYDSIEQTDQLKATIKENQKQKQTLLIKLETIERTYRERMSKMQSDYQLLMKQKIQAQKSRQFFNSQMKKKDQKYQKLRSKMESMDQRNIRLTHVQIKKINHQPKIQLPDIHHEKYTSLLQQNQQLKSMLYHIFQQISKTQQIRQDLLETRRQFNENVDTSNMTIMLESKFVRAPLTTGRHAMTAFDSNIRKFQKLLSDIDAGRNYTVNQQDSVKITALLNIKNKLGSYRQIMDGYSQILQAFLNEATDSLTKQQISSMENAVQKRLHETDEQQQRMMELTRNQ